MPIDLFDSASLAPLRAFTTSLAIGLLMGLERERSPAAKAGLRTFALTALLGTLAGLLSSTLETPWIVVAGLLVIGTAIVAAYVHPASDHADPGTTTEVALVFCYGLGVLCWYEARNLAVMLGIAATVLLYYKSELSGIARGLTPKDLRSMLQFAVLSLVILPVLPNQDFGPYDAINLRQAWLMVVLISGVSLAGYVVLRLLGERVGAPLLGLLGGVVSSTASTLIYSRLAKENRGHAGFAAVVVVLAHLTVFPRLTLLGAATAPSLLVTLATALGSGLAVGLVLAAFMLGNDTPHSPQPEMNNPTELKTALGFGLLYMIVLLTANWLQDVAGQRGFYMVALASGISDVDAITLTAMRLFNQGKLLPHETVTAVVLAVCANTGFKLTLAASLGGRPFFKQVVLPMTGASLVCLASLLFIAQP